MPETDVWTLIYQLIYYFPWYVGLVLVPMAIRVVIERSIGIRPETFESSVNPLLPVGMSYENAFRTIALTVLYFPLFEELIFRGLPYLLFGGMGVVVGSTVWVIMHPAWQLQYLASYPLRKKLVFTATSTGYYATNAVFYSMMWVNDAGLAAILYHIFHNGWLTLGDIIKEVELPAPWKRYKYVRKQPIAEETPILKLLRREEKRREESGDEEKEMPSKPRFVVRKARRSLADEVEEAKKYMFVKRKVKNDESEEI